MSDNTGELLKSFVIESSQEALKRKHKTIDIIHVFKAILDSQTNIMKLLVQDANPGESSGDAFPSLCKVIDELLDQLPSDETVVSKSDLVTSPNVSKLLDFSVSFMKQDHKSEMSIKHILQGISIMGENSGINTVFNAFGLNKTALYNNFDKYGTAVIDHEKLNDIAGNTDNSLSKYAVDLVEEAKKGNLDPVIGRDSELRQIIQVLTRRSKNNPVVVGEPGVGKTALLNALAQRIADDDVPVNLKDCSLFSLSITKVLAGAAYKGEFEGRMEKIIKEVQNSNGKYILFIDEIHTIMESAEGQSSTADILKPALSNGKMSCIGATTYNEYQKHFEKDATMDRRFQKVQVEEPSEEMCITILRGLKERYENYHKVQITDDAIIYTVKMAKRYIPFRSLPDSAIDLIDEACSKIRMEILSKPTVLDKIQRELTTTEIAIKVLESDEDDGNKEKIEKLKEHKSQIESEVEVLQIQWELEQRLIQSIQKNKKEHEELLKRKEEFQKKGQIDSAAISEREALECQKKIDKFQAELNEVHKKHQLIKEAVTEQEVSEIISDKTGIPVTKIGSSEQEKLVNIEREIKKSVVGQDHAIAEIANAIRVNRVPGIGDKNRPIGSFMFAGTTGVGKTYLAKMMAAYLFDDENSIVRIDMSEFSEKHAVSRLIGAPPGYVGYDEGGQLTEAVRNNPFCIVLLDEIEKAHPDFMNILLQVLDDGMLTDSKGRRVNFKNVIIVMTTNIGSDIIQENFDENENELSDEMITTTSKEVMDKIKNEMRPEVLNRIDEIIMFNPLGKDQIKNITELELTKFKKNLQEEGGYTLSWTNSALKYIAKAGYNPAYGARPVKRAISDIVREPLSLAILKGEVGSGGEIEMDVKPGGGVKFQNKVEEHAVA